MTNKFKPGDTVKWVGMNGAYFNYGDEWDIEAINEETGGLILVDPEGKLQGADWDAGFFALVDSSPPSFVDFDEAVLVELTPKEAVQTILLGVEVKVRSAIGQSLRTSLHWDEEKGIVDQFRNSWSINSIERYFRERSVIPGGWVNVLLSDKKQIIFGVILPSREQALQVKYQNAKRIACIKMPAILEGEGL